MADCEDDAFYASLESYSNTVETALLSKCNMNQQMREDARKALGELKFLVTRQFEKIKSVVYREVCNESVLNYVQKKLYSESVAPSVGQQNRNSSSCSLLISAENCNSEDVKKLFKAQIDPKKDKLGIRHVKSISEDTVLVHCASEADRNKLMTSIETNSEILRPTVPKRKNPTLLIKNVPNDIGNSEILDTIYEQNPEVFDSDECWNESRVRFVLKQFQHVRSVVVEVHPKVRKKIIALRSLKMMWNMCNVEDFVVINRCFLCLGYNHRSMECRNKLSCYFCSGEHKSSECQNCEDQVCVNCIRYNKKLKSVVKKVDVKHKPFSQSCTCHTFMRDKMIARIDYG